MELRHLRYFVAVAEELHFGRAAERLHMAQPPLSQQIRQLETEMGVVLFARTNRRVELTAAGEVFLAEARGILRQVEQAATRARRAGRGEWGWLGVGFAGSATYDVLPSILRRFRELYPDVELGLQELSSEEQEQALLERRLHLGFTRISLPAPGLVSEPLLHEPLVLALPSTHRFARRKKIHLRELAEESFILFHEIVPSGFGAFLVRACQEAGFTPRVAQRVGEIQTAIGLVCAGIGLTLVPASAQNFQREGVIYKALADPAPAIALMLAYREEERSPVLAHFLRVTREVVRQV